MSGDRPAVYKPENADIARKACLLGATNYTLAERFEVSPDVIDTWIWYKQTKEVEALRARPHPYEFQLYYDV